MVDTAFFTSVNIVGRFLVSFAPVNPSSIEGDVNLVNNGDIERKIDGQV